MKKTSYISFFLLLALLADFSVFKHDVSEVFSAICVIGLLLVFYKEPKIKIISIFLLVIVNISILLTSLFLIDVDNINYLSINIKTIFAIFLAKDIYQFYQNHSVRPIYIPRILTIHGLLGFFIFPFISVHLSDGGHLASTTFYYIFWYDSGIGLDVNFPFAMRAQGVFAEAGLFGMFCFLYYQFFARNKLDKCIAGLGMITSLSLGTFIIFVIHKFLASRKVNNQFGILLIGITLPIVAFVLYRQNLYGGSSILRALDILRGAEFIYLNSLYIWGGFYGLIESSFYVDINNIQFDLDSRGTSNGLIKLIAGVGLPGMLILSYCVGRNLRMTFQTSASYGITFLMLHMMQPITFSLAWFLIIAGALYRPNIMRDMN